METMISSYKGRYAMIVILGALLAGRYSVAVAHDYPKSRDAFCPLIVDLNAGS